MTKNPKAGRAVKIYFIIPTPEGISPSQRFRFEHYLPYLQQQGITYRFSSFYSIRGWSILHKDGMLLKKAGLVFGGFFRRFLDLFRLLSYDYIFIHREAAPIGPPVFEWIISKLLRKKIIYDFDDAIWIPVSSSANRMAKGLRFFGKVASICRWSYKVSVGNDYLGAFASKQGAKNVIIVPTVVNTEQTHGIIQNQDTDKPVIGWTGTFSTLKYLDIVLPVLQSLQEKIDFLFVVIADRDPGLPLKNYRFIRWQKTTETQDLLSMHIGLMPLYDDEISKGKCGFKAIQYMAMGIPAVVSPVGVNSVIVDDKINGFICDDAEQWERILTRLLTDKSLRTAIGKAAREKIVAAYSVVATRDKFVSLFS